MNERIQTLLERVAQLEHAPPTSRRREDLIARAVDAGHLHEYANQMYDVAAEEGVDPAIAFEIVLSGVGVRELAPPNNDSWEETQVEAPPVWLTDNHPPPPDDAARERRIRASFRRLRSLTESSATPQEALRTFVSEPDVGEVDY